MTKIPVSIKYGGTTYHMHLVDSPELSKSEQFNMIASYIHIPVNGLKLIHKGKRYTKENWHELTLVPNMNFLAIGEQQEDDTNVDMKDIECIMHQLKVDRNTAVRTLKLHPNVIDAILYLGNT
ncbi:unnamed protein product [Adineta ricciae]|uniref:Uncharacterized protein n=1 Tax=Adineta ricciae TaxID=249248 RepID=A0A813ZLW4_ADIRI|nr:unnamed protein product [Adineta ricciae]